MSKTILSRASAKTKQSQHDIDLQAQQASKVDEGAHNSAVSRMAGQPLKGDEKINGKALKLRRKGQHLQLEIGDEEVLELTDHFAQPDVELEGSEWAFASDGAELAGSSGVTALGEPTLLAQASSDGLTQTGTVTDVGASSTASIPTALGTEVGVAAQGVGMMSGLGWGAVAAIGVVGWTVVNDDGGAVVAGATKAIELGGSISAGKSVAGITIRAYDSNGVEVGQTVTDQDGKYTLSIDAKYAGQALLLKASDETADGKGYTDEASGESKDVSINLRAVVQLSAETNVAQKAQISTATELATRVLGIGDDNRLSSTSSTSIKAANQEVAKFLGMTEDIVNTTAPDVVGKGDDNTTSNAYGKALAWLSGMDSVVERSGASNPTDAALKKLASAFQLNVSGTVTTKFNDPELLNLLSQAVTEVAQTQGSELGKDLSSVALKAVASQSSTGGSTGTSVAFFMTSSRNLIGDGKTAKLQLSFDKAPTDAQLADLTQALVVTGGTLGALIKDSTDASGKTYTATFTQVGMDTPQIRVNSTSYFANDISMVLDNTAPTLNVARIDGIDSTGAAKTTVKAGDTVSVTLAASESVKVSDASNLKLKLNVGGQEVEASYNTAKSGTRSLVFDYVVENQRNAAQGVSVVGLKTTTATITDMADNNAAPNLVNYSGLPVYVDTTAPVVLAQLPLDGNTVGNAGVRSISLSFGEAIAVGSAGTVVLKNASDTAVASWNAADGVVSADGRSVSYALPTTLSTLPAGNYTVTATGTPIVDKAGNAIDTSHLASDGTWSFSVGAITIGIDKVSGDNLLNAAEIGKAIALTGSLSGEGSAGVRAADMQVWLQPVGGGAQVQATVNSLGDGSWSATLSATNAASLQGGYVVKVSIDTANVKASASSALMVDTQAQITLGAVAGDNQISLVEQAVIKSGKSLSYSFVAEKGSSGSLDFQSTTDATKKVTKPFTNAKGSSPDSVTLSKDDLAALGAGTFQVKATVTDVAGNTNTTTTQAFSIEAPAIAAQISGITLQGTRSGTLIQGDTLTASVNFDKAVTVNNADALTLSLQVGSTTRQAKFTGISADRKQLLFSYTVAAGDADTDGVALNANALQLGTGTGAATINDVALGTAATITSASVGAVTTLKVDGTITNAPADLALNVIEAGLTATHQPTQGKATAGGSLLTGEQKSSSNTITKAQVGSGAEVTINASGDTDVQGAYGKWTLKSNGSYTYTLNNSNTAVNALAKGQTQTESLNFWVSGARSAAPASVTITGSNDAPVVSAAITQSVAESNSAATAVTINLLQGASDVDAGETATLSIANLTYKVGTAAASATPPAGVTLSSDGKTLSVDPASAAFNSLAQGATQTVLVSYQVRDAQGATVNQTATLTITGSNDAPTITASTPSATLVEAGGVNNGTAGTNSASVTLTTGDVDGTASYDTAYLTAQGWVAGGSSTNGTYTNTGTYGTATLNVSTGVVSYVLDNAKAATQALTAGQQVTETFTVQVTDGSATATANAVFNITGSNDAPTITASTPSATLVEAGGINNGTAGTNSASVTLTTGDVDTDDLANYDTAYLTAQGWMAGSSGTYTNTGTYGTATLNVSTGVVSYILDNAKAATQALTAGQQVTETFTVQVTDGSATASANAVFNITGSNDAPTALTLSNTVTSLAENSDTTTRVKVADIAVTDDAPGSNTLTLDGADKEFFEISGNALYLKAGTVLDYENRAHYAVTVKAQDSSLADSMAVTQNLTLAVTDVAEAPSAIALSSNTIAENVAVGTAGVEIGTLTVTDPDTSGNNNVLTVSDTTNFKVENGKLIFIGASPNFETTPSYNVTVTSTDGSLVKAQDFTINVTDVNDAPSAINLSANNIAENTTIPADGVKIGDITLIDPDATGNNNALSLTGAGNDNASFAIRTDSNTGVSSLYYTGTSPSYASKSLYNLTVTSTDTNNGNALTKTTDFVVNVGQAAINAALNGYTYSNAPAAGLPTIYNHEATSADGSANQTDAAKRLGQYINAVTGTDVVSDAEFDAGFTLTGKAAAGAQATIKWRLDNDRTTGANGEGAQVLSIGDNDVDNADGDNNNATGSDVTVAYNNDTGDWRMVFAAGSKALLQATHNAYGSGVHQLLVDTDGNTSRTGAGASIEASRLFLVAAGTAGVTSKDKDGIDVTSATLAANFSVQDRLSNEVFVYYYGDPDGAGVSERSKLTAEVNKLRTNMAGQTWEMHMATSSATPTWTEAKNNAADHTLWNSSNSSRFSSLSEMVALYGANFSGTGTSAGTVDKFDPVAGNDNTPKNWGSWFFTASPGPLNVTLWDLAQGRGTTEGGLGNTSYAVTLASIDNAPTSIQLSRNTVAENTTATGSDGVEIATLWVSPSKAPELTVSDTSNFKILNGKLYFIGGNLDFEDKAAYPVTVTSTDGSVVTTQDFTINVTNVNEAPTVNSAKALTGQTATVGSSFSYTFDAAAFIDPEGTALTYSATLADGTALPIWLSFNTTTTTCTFSGTAPTSATQLNVKVTASDGSLTTSSNFTWNVTAAAPVDTSTKLPDWIKSSTYVAKNAGVQAAPTSQDPGTPAQGMASLLGNDEDQASWLARDANGVRPTGASLTAPLALTYAYQNPGAQFNDGTTDKTVDGQYSDAAKSFIDSVFAHFASVINVTFTDMSDSPTSQKLVGEGGADLRLFTGTATNLGTQKTTLGYAFQPSNNDPKTVDSDGNFFLVSDAEGLPQTGAFTTPYGDERNTVAHELGHALGLDHPFNSDAGDTAGFDWYGGTDKLTNNLGLSTGGAHDTPKTDTMLETIMTYDNPYTGPDPIVTPWKLGVYDIAALQHLYGANMKTNATDTSYTYDSTTLVFDTIWDAGGGQDAIVQTGSQSAIIDLRGGDHFSRVGKGLDGITVPDPSMAYNLGIAFGVVIENAVGGDGNDVVWGNAAANRIRLGDGNDVVKYASVDDIKGDMLLDFAAVDRLDLSGLGLRNDTDSSKLNWDSTNKTLSYTETSQAQALWQLSIETVNFDKNEQVIWA